jgi:uncharacterized protein
MSAHFFSRCIVRSFRLETHLPTAQSPAKTQSRIQSSHGLQGRTPRPREQAPQGTQTAHARLIGSHAAVSKPSRPARVRARPAPGSCRVCQAPRRLRILSAIAADARDAGRHRDHEKSRQSSGSQSLAPALQSDLGRIVHRGQRHLVCHPVPSGGGRFVLSATARLARGNACEQHAARARRADATHSDRFMSLVVGAIRLYQRTISKMLPQACRFTPSCSEYAAQAVERYGALRGLKLAGLRLLRCGPWHPGGIDPVP